MFEGVPTYPDSGRFWQVVEKHKVTIFYTAPTAIRALMQVMPWWKMIAVLCDYWGLWVNLLTQKRGCGIETLLVRAAVRL